MPVSRLLPTDDARLLLDLTQEICEKTLAPAVDEAERRSEFPSDAYRVLGKAGLLALPYPERFGGAAQPYEVYLQVIEALATTWMSVAVGASVHTLTCFPVIAYGTPEQQEALLPELLGGEQLGAYALSESGAGSDVGAMTMRAVPDGGGYRLHGSKAWISNAGHADFYTTFARTSDDGPRGLTCFVVPADAPGLSFASPERTMGLHSDPVRQVHYEGVFVPVERRIGEEGQGMSIALAALDNGRLGIAAGATGLAQAALDVATAYANEREQFGQSIGRFQGVAFLLADMAAAVVSARATYLHAARLKDAGRAFTAEASVAKLVATDAAMKVTTDAVQVLGGAGYTDAYPAERYMREAKVTQIFEGTNQIQRLVISRHLLG